MTDEAQRTLTSLKVTNHNDFAIEDRFDGVPYLFEPGRAISVPADAALHMLGWYPGVGMDAVKNHVCKRWGWNTPAIVNEKLHDKYFAALNFKPVTYKIIEVPALEEEVDEAPPSTEKKAKNGKTSHEANA